MLTFGCGQKLIIKYDSKQTSRFYPNDNLIIIEHGSEKDFDTIMHEFGHFIDYNYVGSWKNKAFLDAINSYIYTLPSKPPTNPMIHDIISAIYCGRIGTIWGHDKIYWSFAGNRQKEIFANLFCIHVRRDVESIKYMQKQFPEIEDQFLKICLDNGVEF
jgi:hypothetical protein